MKLIGSSFARSSDNKRSYWQYVVILTNALIKS
jgi:hypothetical protein